MLFIRFFCSCTLKSNLCKVSHILVWIIWHFLQWTNELVTEDASIDVLSLSVDDFRNAEFDIWNIILGCLNENWNYLWCNLILHDVRHNCWQRVEAAHSVVVSFFVNGVMIIDNWDVLLHDPVLFERLSKDLTLLNSHLTNTGSGVCKVLHENTLEVFAEDIFTKDDSEVSNELKNAHSDSPLAILSHIG